MLQPLLNMYVQYMYLCERPHLGQHSVHIRHHLKNSQYL